MSCACGAFQLRWASTAKWQGGDTASANVPSLSETAKSNGPRENLRRGSLQQHQRTSAPRSNKTKGTCLNGGPRAVQRTSRMPPWLKRPLPSAPASCFTGPPSTAPGAPPGRALSFCCCRVANCRPARPGSGEKSYPRRQESRWACWLARWGDSDNSEALSPLTFALRARSFQPAAWLW